MKGLGDSPVLGGCCWSLLYSVILCSRADSLRSHLILHEWLAFYGVFLNIHRSGVLTVLFVTWLMPHETAAILARSAYTIQPCTTSRHFMQNHIHSCNLPPALLAAEWLGSFMCYCSSTGVEWIPELGSAAEANSPAAPAGAWTWDFDHESGDITTELSPLTSMSGLGNTVPC